MTRRMRRHASLEIPLAFPRILATAVAPLIRKRGLQSGKRLEPRGTSRTRLWVLCMLGVLAFAVVRLLTL